ncbi:MAG TPA: hypothetical protein VLL49_10705 [Anaerolineales bacterium]|nr:hypothetical protein [Anaerolineales bacterium]
MTALSIVLLLLVLLILVGNTMMAIAFLRNRPRNLRSIQRRDSQAMDELHRRVQELASRDK